MKILEEFWYGNIEPTEYDTSSKEYKKLQELICRNEEKLKATMTDEQKELFEKYTDCVREHQTNTDCLIFQNGFSIMDDVVFEMELVKQVEVNIDYILMLVMKYHDGNCEDKEILVAIDKAIKSSLQLRSKKELIENFIAKQEGVTEALKAADQMEWVRRMNSIHNRIEEMLFSELIYD
jgi:type I site-specific restriction-modification system R (restriction) subunit